MTVPPSIGGGGGGVPFLGGAPLAESTPAKMIKNVNFFMTKGFRAMEAMESIGKMKIKNKIQDLLKICLVTRACILQIP
jgi:hypothetical protein